MAILLVYRKTLCWDRTDFTLVSLNGMCTYTYNALFPWEIAKASKACFYFSAKYEYTSEAAFCKEEFLSSLVKLPKA